VINTPAVQRLRHVHQLALTSFVYPGATHKRFEHSLGTMELASRIYAVVTREDHLSAEIKDLLPELTEPDVVGYWRRVLRMAALCHDLGHLPFSHAAEKELLPDGWNHERLSRLIIEDMADVWGSRSAGPLLPKHIVKLALGPKSAKDLGFSLWETVLSEIIVGDAFGADRIDYLLRDSHHAGVSYGRFDHYRLIDTLRLLPNDVGEPALGIEMGGLHSAEALLLARYFMYSQVYYHPIRAVYDIHLIDFLRTWLPGGMFPIEIGEHLKLTDNEVFAGMAQRAGTGDESARRILERKHFKVLYTRNRVDAGIDPDVVHRVFEAAAERFDEANVRKSQRLESDKILDFPVSLGADLGSAQGLSDVLSQLPVIATGYVFIEPGLREDAGKWWSQEKSKVIQPAKEDS
jgi:uncharacterized protein